MKIDKDLVAFITGASSGFGWEIARDLLDQGARCYLTDINDQAKEFTQKYPNRAIFRKADITDDQGIKESFDDCAKNFGYVSVVVNSAGVICPNISILDKDFNNDQLKSLIKINVVGAFIVSKYAGLQFVKQQQQNKEHKDYLLINFGSSASTHASNGMSIYGATKGAVLGMTLPMSRDLGKYGVRVVCMTPGIFNTNMGKSFPPRLLQAVAKTTALGRNGEPQELSHAVQGVIKSSFMTGTFFHMDSSFGSPHL